MIETDNYVFFYGSIYSQWAPTPFREGDLVFNCAEQYMMYWKALAFGDLQAADEIMASEDPSDQKSIGRRIKGFNDERWNLIKYQVVYQGNLLKFSQNPELLLILTNAHKDKMFVEASPTDRIWGIGIGLGNPDMYDESKWDGENLLGKAIKDVQQHLLNV